MGTGRFFALFVFLAANAAAQHLAQVYGRILDTSEGGIAQALVTVVNQENGFRRATQSEPGGGYAVGSLQPGQYKISVRRDGFHTVERYDVRLTPAAPTRADFVLPIGPVEESITVYDSAPMIEREDASTGTRVDHEQIDRLPLNGRGVLSLLEMSPGTSVTPATRGEAGQFTTTGQRPNTNYFTIDGMSANTGVMAGGLPAQSTGGSLPALSAFGSLDSLISLDAVQEFRVTTSTSMAEFGRLPGATVALSSRSGTNSVHGSANYRIRNELLDANDWFANQAGIGSLPLRLQDSSQTLGAPLKRNSTFVFLSYQRIALRQPFVWRQPVPTLDLRAQAPDWAKPMLKLFPQPRMDATIVGIGEATGRSVRPAALDAGGNRNDQALGSRLSFFGRYNDSPSHNEFGTLATNRLDLRARSLTAALNARVRPWLVLDFRANESQADTSSAWTPGTPCALKPLTDFFLFRLDPPPPCDYLVRFSIAGVGQLVSGREGDRRQRQFQALPSASLRLGAHSIGIGTDYRRILAIRRDPTDSFSVIADDILSILDTRKLWKASGTAQNDSVRVKETSAWVQDIWQAAPRLTISAGLRWEYSPAPIPDQPVNFVDPLTNALTSDRSRLWGDWSRNFAPRFGMALRLTADGRTVLRGGAGLYFDSSVSIATDTLNGGPLTLSGFSSGIHAPLPTQFDYGFFTGLKLPRVKQWNVALERGFTPHDIVSLGYLGSSGEYLLRREVGPGSIPTSYYALTTNHAFSDYHALQLQYRRQLTRGLEATAAYTWSHSIDNNSSDSNLLWVTPGYSDKGSSDFDLRHSLNATATYEFPHFKTQRWLARVAEGWALDGIFRARTGFPVSVLDSDEYLGITFVNAFRPDLNFGQPLWISDSGLPAGRRLNPGAFSATAPGNQGTLGRNPLAGFGMYQVDLALRREFRVSEWSRLQFRLEAFNLLNHPSFADPVRYLSSPVMGESTSMLNLMLGNGSPASGLTPVLQTGGARSLQAALRWWF
jgi:hypothetical protein